MRCRADQLGFLAWVHFYILRLISAAVAMRACRVLRRTVVIMLLVKCLEFFLPTLAQRISHDIVSPDQCTWVQA